MASFHSQISASDWLYNSPMRLKQFIILLLSVVLVFSFVTASISWAQPVDAITILSPGFGSQVVDPIVVTAIVVPGPDGLIRVTLVDQHQNLLARQLLRVDASAKTTVVFSTELAFEIPTENSTALITIATQDDLNRPLALRSVALTLTKSTEAVLTAPLSSDPWLSISNPEPGAIIRGLPILVSGTVRPVNDNPVIIELLNERGAAIASKQLLVETLGDQFEFEVPLILMPVESVRNMRLVIRQSTGWAGVDAILDSLPITLPP